MRPFHCSNSTDRPGECPARILTLTPWSECLIKHSSHSSHLLLYISLSLYSPSLPPVCLYVARYGALSTLSCLHRTQPVSKQGFRPQKGPCLFFYEPAESRVWRLNWEISALQIQTFQFDQILSSDPNISNMFS